MKNLFLFLLLLFCFTLEAQEMQWVPTTELTGKGCDDLTDCSQNIVCYSLAYTPSHDGVVSSYTTGFLVDCDGGGTALISNASCTMNDKSEAMLACEEAGKLLLFCSANSGDLVVSADKRVIIHQICVQTSNESGSLEFEPDPTVGLTASLDLADQPPITETIHGSKFYLPRNYSVCGGNSPDGTVTDSPFDTGTTGLDETIGIKLYPNPVVNNLRVRINLPAEKTSFNILDASGKMMMNGNVNTGVSNSFDVSKLPSGTYLFKVGKDQAELTRKFVIVH